MLEDEFTRLILDDDEMSKLLETRPAERAKMLRSEFNLGCLASGHPLHFDLLWRQWPTNY